MIEVDRQDLVAAGVDLQQTDARPSRVQPGLQGIFELMFDPAA